MNELLLQLRDKGNTVLVVEHKPETIAIADHVVDLGPGAGTAGGEVVFEGTVEGLRGSDTVTGRHLDDRARLKDDGAHALRRARDPGRRRQQPPGRRRRPPARACCASLTGVAGSGKSSLVQGSVAGRDGVVVVDQGAIRGSRRSNPATYTGLLEPIRKAFAKANGVKPALFSSNSEGACPACKGAGRHLHRARCHGDRRVDLRGVRGQALPGRGARVHARRPQHRRGAGDAGDRGRGVLRRGRGAHARPRTRSWTRLADVGPRLLSASASRSPRCRAASGSGSSWPRRWPRRARSTSSTSPRPACTWPTSSSCSACSTGWSTPGKSVIVIEHHQAVMAHADWIIDLGPGAGHDGGTGRLRGHARRPRRRSVDPHRASTSRRTSAGDPASVDG